MVGKPLEQQIADLQERLAKAKAKKSQRDARLQRAAAAKARAEDTRRKILAGAVILQRAEENPETKAGLWRLLDQRLTRPQDRALFGLAPSRGQ